MTTAFLPETVVQRTRGFLMATGVQTPPWLGAREVVDRLADLFVARRAADGDRGKLLGFLGELKAAAEDGVARERLRELDAEVLRPSEVADVIEALSRELSDGADRRTILDGLLSCLHAPALSALLLLGIAAGCETSGGAATDAVEATDCLPPIDAEVPADTVSDDASATDAGAELTDAEAKNRLVAWVDDSTLSADRKTALVECIQKGLDPATRVDLAELFATMTPQQIAAYLADMVKPGGLCASYYQVNPEPSPDVFDAIPAYKGVSFS
jgi:hypothetical protein